MTGSHGRRLTTTAAALLCLAALSGCVATAVGAGAVAGDTALQDRGIKGAVSDNAIRAEINHYWLEKDHKMWMALNLQVYEGRVLVSGTVPNADARSDAISLAWKAKGVREVFDEVEVTNDGGIVDYARDTKIQTELNAKILFAKGVESVNYSAEVVNGVVYLLGVAQDQAELDRVLSIARNLADVKKVVSHVIMKDDPQRFKSASTG
ncbi:MAG TPA: BON domain-containing protein [Alphaproteobacteria bacterium]|nr:BON domain-containing protein [Alphaproteobacteria bacterium]